MPAAAQARLAKRPRIRPGAERTDARRSGGKSVSRKVWAALSSLARQRTLEDEEEQERERRRRHRNLSFATDDEDPPAPETAERGGSRGAPATGPRPQRWGGCLGRPEDAAGEEAEAPGGPVPEPPEEQVQPETEPRARLRGGGGPGGQGACRLREASAAKTLESEASLDPETPSPRKRSVSQKIAVLEERAVPGKRAVPDKASISEKRMVSEKATVFKKTPAPETQPAPGRAMAPARPQAREHPASGAPASPGGQRGAGPEKEPESSAGPLPRAGGLPPVTLQVRAPGTDAEAEVPSPTRGSPTFSSALQRSSPRTTSFRVSPWRDSSEAALTRSACVRLPASSVKLGPKLERYHSAIQRSESVKCASPACTEFLVAPVDVASKRHLFEKELVGQSREVPASGRKRNLQLSRVVMWQLNLWIGRTQEPAQQGRQNQEPPLGAEV